MSSHFTGLHQTSQAWNRSILANGKIAKHVFFRGTVNQYYFIAAWQNAGPQFAQIKIQYSTIKYNSVKML